MKVKTFLDKYKDACSPARDWMRENSIQTMEEAWDRCERSDWMIWTLRKIEFNDKMVWVKLAVASAKRVLPIYEKKYKNDAPRKAIETVEAWIIDPTEENRMNCKSAAAYAAAADAAYAAYAAYAAADAAYAAAARMKERSAQAKIIRTLVKNPFIKD